MVHLLFWVKTTKLDVFSGGLETKMAGPAMAQYLCQCLTWCARKQKAGIACKVSSFAILWVEALDLVWVEPYNAVLPFHQFVENAEDCVCLTTRLCTTFASTY